MASTYSTNLAIELIGTGEQSGTWGTTTNTNLGTLLEQAISGYVTQPITDGSGANTTITIPNGTTGVARNMFIEMTGALSFSTTSLIVPANKKMYFIFNNTSGGFAVTVKVSGQTGILVPNGKKVVLVSNGTDIVEAHTAIVGNATMGGTLGVTGATTLSGALTYGGVTLSNAVTGTGNMVLSASPTVTGTFSGATINASVGFNGILGGTTPAAASVTTLTATGVGSFTAGSGAITLTPASAASSARTNIYWAAKNSTGDVRSTYFGSNMTFADGSTELDAQVTLNLMINGVVKTALTSTGASITGTLSATKNANADQSFTLTNTTAGTAAGVRMDMVGDSGGGQLTFYQFNTSYSGTVFGLTASKLKAVFDNSITADSNGLAIGTSGNVPLYFIQNSSERGRFDANGLSITGTLGVSQLSTFSAGSVSILSANSLQFGAKVQNNNAATGTAAIAFSSDATYYKAAIGLTRADANGKGSLNFYVDNASDAADVSTGDLVMSVVGTGASITGTLSATGDATVHSATTGNKTLLLGGSPASNAAAQIRMEASNTLVSWHMATNYNVVNGWELAYSTAAGGSTYNNPVLSVLTTGLAVTGALSATGNVTVGTNATNEELNIVGTGAAGGTLLFKSDTTEKLYVNGGQAYNMFSAGELGMATAADVDLIFGRNNAEKFRATSTGLSITGTLTTSGKATVNAALDVNPAFGSGIYVSPSTDSNGEASVLRLYGGANQFTNRYVEISCYNNGGSNVNEMVFKVGNVGTILEAMKINYVGDVTIPGTLLVGTTANNAFGAKNTVAAVYTAYLWNQASSGDNLFLEFSTDAGGNSRGSISYNRAGGLTAYNTTSDYRLKEHVIDLPNALETVSKLKPRQFDWKETGNTTTGFIAHELAEVCPHAVTGEKDATEIKKYEITPAVHATFDEEGKELTAAVEAVMGEREVPMYQGIDTSFLVATLTAAIQELNSKFEEYKSTHP